MPVLVGHWRDAERQLYSLVYLKGSVRKVSYCTAHSNMQAFWKVWNSDQISLICQDWKPDIGHNHNSLRCLTQCHVFWTMTFWWAIMWACETCRPWMFFFLNFFFLNVFGITCYHVYKHAFFTSYELLMQFISHISLPVCSTSSFWLASLLGCAFVRPHFKRLCCCWCQQMHDKFQVSAYHSEWK